MTASPPLVQPRTPTTHNDQLRSYYSNHSIEFSASGSKRASKQALDNTSAISYNNSGSMLLIVHGLTAKTTVRPIASTDFYRKAID